MPANTVANAGVGSYDGLSPNYGRFTSQYALEQPQIFEIQRSVELMTQRNQDFIGEFCQITTQDHVLVVQDGGEMQEVGPDGGLPDPQRMPQIILDLARPRIFAASGKIDLTAYWDEIQPEQLAEQTLQPLRLDRRHCARVVFGTMLSEGGWYNQTYTPPPVAADTFDANHDHYLTYAAGGRIEPDMSAFCAWHIQHHGYWDSPIVCFANPATGPAIQSEYGTLATPDAYDSLPFVQRLVEFGFTTAQPLGGVPTLLTSWVPVNYALYVALSPGKPMYWRPKRNPACWGFVYMMDSTTPNPETYWYGTGFRVGWPTIWQHGMGVAVQLNAAVEGDAYVAPTNILNFAV